MKGPPNKLGEPFSYCRNCKNAKILRPRDHKKSVKHILIREPWEIKPFDLIPTLGCLTTVKCWWICRGAKPEIRILEQPLQAALRWAVVCCF